MSTPTFTPAQKTAAALLTQIINLPIQVRQQVSRLNNVVNEGVPAQGTNEAISAADIQASLGTNLATAQAILAALLNSLPSSS